MDGRKDGQAVDRQTDGWTDRRTGRRTDGRTDGRTDTDRVTRVLPTDHVRKPTANQAYLAEFCETFYNKMLSLVARCVSARRHVVTDQYVLEILQHLSVCRARREGFRGREALIARIRRYVTRARRPGGGAGGVGGALAGVARDQPLVVYGQSGSGKTSVLAKAACMVHGWFAPPTRPVLVVRFLGRWRHGRRPVHVGECRNVTY